MSTRSSSRRAESSASASSSLLRGQHLRDATAPLTDELAEGRLVLWGNLAHRRIQDRERRPIGDMRGASRFQLCGCGGGADRFERCGDGGFHRLGRDLWSV